MTSRPLKIAHRSGPAVYPEQTVAAARDSLEKGADLIEIDLRFTKDGKIVVSHDENVSRVYGKDINVNELTLSEFVKLTHTDAPEYHAHAFGDYIDAGVKPLLLHIKEGGEEHLGAIVDFLIEKNYLEYVTFGISHVEDCEYLKKRNSGIKVLAFMIKGDIPEKYAEAGADYIRLWQGKADSENINRVIACGCKLWIMVGHSDGYDVGETSREFIEFLYTQPVDGILINDITKL